MVTKKSLAELNKSQREGKRELEQAMQRISKLDKIIQRLYEDNVEGKISDERFAKMSANYEAEQEQLEARINELKDLLSAEKEESLINVIFGIPFFFEQRIVNLLFDTSVCMVLCVLPSLFCDFFYQF